MPVLLIIIDNYHDHNDVRTNYGGYEHNTEFPTRVFLRFGNSELRKFVGKNFFRCRETLSRISDNPHSPDPSGELGFRAIDGEFYIKYQS